MTDNVKSPFSFIIIEGKSEAIKVEKSLEELTKMLNDNSGLIAITDLEGIHYILPKIYIKLISSYGEQNTRA